MKVYHRRGIGLSFIYRERGGRMAEINQSNVYMLLHWKVAGLAQLWAKDLGVSTLEAMMRFYDTPFYAKLEDESTKLWTYSPQQLYYLFRNAA